MVPSKPPFVWIFHLLENADPQNPISTKFSGAEKFGIASESPGETYIDRKPYKMAFKCTSNILYLPAK